MSADSTSTDQLQTQNLQLLDKIDELRAIGVGGLVELPQIVVYGSQLSDKSSVLERISNVTLSTIRDPCDRLVTEIVSRRASHERVRLCIRPGDSRINGEGQRGLRHFTSDEIDISSTPFSFSRKLKELLERASSCMGLSTLALQVNDDVLRVEVSGPQQPDLTLIDLSGLSLFSNTVQNNEEKELIDSILEGYLKSSRSFVLAVLSGKNDCHDQSILKIIKRFDPNQERHLRIAAPPCPTDLGLGKQDPYLQFIKIEDVKSESAWHVLPNGSAEKHHTPDNKLEVQEKEPFDHGKWASLSPDQVGIETLIVRLSSILLCLMRRNLPDLIDDIQNKIWDNELELEKMGAPRATVQEQRQYLIDISSQFGRITNQALNGSYVHEFFGGFREGTTRTGEFEFQRLRAVIQEMNESFEEAMTIRGARRIIQLTGATVDVDSEMKRPNPYMHGWTPVYITQGDMEQEIKDMMHRRGVIEETGRANQLVVGSLFRDQCEPWEMIARAHVLNTWGAVECFVQLVLKHLTNDHTRSSLTESVLRSGLDKMKVCLLEKLGELCLHYKSSHPVPAGRSFLSRIQSSRTKRQVSASNKSTKSNTLPQKSNEQLRAAEIIDHMQAYYKTAIDTFVDNVIILAVENCLLRKLEDIFTGKTVIAMEDHEIEKVAAEPPKTRYKRDRLEDEVSRLHEAMQSLKVFDRDDSMTRAFRDLGKNRNSPSELHKAKSKRGSKSIEVKD
ncbi:Dynamin [Penicillium brevicompactum]|uniref:Dynamin n=1 Tax=Penicillium brevicompactum TaxID=5074 RepID=A0A9W9RVC4_PENBR|nr:Dynamin [Penicillium brevicompactum]